MNQFLRKLGWLFYRRRKEAELREELEFHLKTEAEERRAMGLPDEQARQSARRELGNLTTLEEETRATWGWTAIEQLGQDLRYAARTMASNRTFTAVAVLSLALGIGANTAIYSFMDSILLRSLPVPRPESLVVMKWRAQGFPSTASSGFSTSTGGTYMNPEGEMIGSVFPYPALELFQNNSDVLASAFCYFGGGHLSITVGEETEAVEAQYVSGDYFRGLGVPPAAGRLFLPTDDRADAAPVVVLSYRYSQRRFGQAEAGVGKSVRVNNALFTVAGIAPPGFFGADPANRPDVWLPMRANQKPLVLSDVAQQYLDSNFYWIEIMARLKPNVDLTRAQVVLGQQFQQFAEHSAANEKERSNLPQLLVLEGAGGLDSLRRRYSKPLYVLITMSGLILLIACSNIANLLLARAQARRREIAVRLSMGAGRLRIIRQLLTESLLLSLLGGSLGLALALWGIRFTTLLLGIGRDNFTLHAELNWHVLGVTLALSLFTGLLFGLVPAIRATRVDVMPVLKQAAAGIVSQTSRSPLAPVNLSQMLVGAQIAFSLLLLVAAGLFGRTLSNLHSVDLGFNRENVLLFDVNPGAMGYEGDRLNRLYVDLRNRLSQIPGVRSVSLSNRPLLSGGGTLALVTLPGATPPSAAPSGASDSPVRAGLFSVGPAFFETMQVPLVAGREFDERDISGAPPAAVVNERFARAFDLEDPVGRTLTLGDSSFQIVGVVGDALFLRLKEDRRPMLYLPSLTRSPARVTYQVRVAGNPLGHVSTVREIVRQFDSRLAVFDLKTQAAHIDQAISQEITLARLCSIFALLALVIACVGLYGTVAFNVERRTGEIGIRVALGAQRPRILWLVLRDVLLLGLAGLAIGVPVAVAGSRYVESFLFGIEPNDPLVIAMAVVVLLAAALIAGYVPARRASRIDPMVALRHE